MTADITLYDGMADDIAAVAAYCGDSFGDAYEAAARLLSSITPPPPAAFSGHNVVGKESGLPHEGITLATIPASSPNSYPEMADDVRRLLGLGTTTAEDYDLAFDRLVVWFTTPSPPTFTDQEITDVMHAWGGSLITSLTRHEARTALTEAWGRGWDARVRRIKETT